MSKVLVLDTNKQPLNPVHPGRARILLASGMAAVLKRYPFTIMLKCVVEHPDVHSLRLKIDPGSQTTGMALVDDLSGDVVFAAELTHRGPAIKHALDQRRAVRRGRRQRNTRYRPPRFHNRRRKAGWLPPSLESRVTNVLTWVRRLGSLCPVGAISVERVKFDLQRMEQPEISGTAYQQGTLLGYEVREYRALEPVFVPSLQGRFWTTNRGVNSLRPGVAPLGVGSLWMMCQKLKPMSVWCYPCGSGLREKLPFEASLALAGETADTPVQRVGMAADIPALCCSTIPSGVKEEPTSCYKVQTGESRNTYAPFPAREAKMPAWGQVDGGGVVVKCLPVMGGTRRRSARESRMNTQRETHGREKVDAGNRNRNRPHRKVNQPRADNEASTGKRNAGKLARSVWKGGKAERPYLSLLLEKWGRACSYCGITGVPLQVEHIQAKANGGTDRVSNLCLACEPCNQAKGTQDIRMFLADHPDRLARLLAQAKTPLKDAAAVNTTRWALYDRLQQEGYPLESGSGGLTKYNRTERRLPKAHWIDAACVGSSTPVRLQLVGVIPLLITATGHGSRQKCNVNDLGFPCSKPKGAKKVKGFQTGDLVSATVTTGTKQGRYVGRVLVRASGWFDIRTKGGRVQGISHRFCKPVHRCDGYNYQCGVRSGQDLSSQAASEGTRHSSPG